MLLSWEHGNPCPKCLSFAGKVLVDDVWSGGRSDGIDPETGKKYPTMSYAISQGLYHPRCKDVHTTYFPGISTADDTWTKKELEDIGLQAKKEVRQQYAKRQAEKFERLAKYSLDEENQSLYTVRKEQWQDIANAPSAIQKATTIKELENAVKEVTGADISLAGTDLELMKKNMEQLSKLCEEYGVHFSEITSTAGRRYLGDVQRTGRYGDKVSMLYPKKYYKDKEALLTELKKSATEGSIPKIGGRNIDIYTTTHEFAHTLSERLTSTLYGKDEDFWDEIESIYFDYKKNGRGVLGKYASTNQNEFLAEAFAEAKLGVNPSEYSSKVLGTVDKYFGKSVVKSKDSGIIMSGARIIDPDSDVGVKFAEMYYGEIRSFSTDVEKIAKNMGKSEKDIKQIKNYLFESGFDPDCAIAQSWQRLMNGKDVKTHDKTLIEHELLEMRIKKENPEIEHWKAHEMATKKYNYQREAEEYYGSLEKHK